MNASRFVMAIVVGIAIAGCGSRQDPSPPASSGASPSSLDFERREASALEGSWTLVSFTAAGKSVEASGGGISFVGGKMIMNAPDGATTTYLYPINPLANPKTLQMTDTQDTNAPPGFAIYEVEGTSPRLCLGREGKPPTAFDAEGGRVFLLHHEQTR